MDAHLDPHPPYHGGPNIEFFTSPESMQGFEVIQQWLKYFCRTYVQSCPPTKETLSELLISFIQFQEEKLGQLSSKRPIMRLPMRCFWDFKQGGSLCHIFANMYRHKYEKNWTKIDFNVTEIANQDQNMQMSKEIFEKMIEQKCICSPTIYVRPEIDDGTLKKIKNTLSKLQCEIATDQDQATHIIYPEMKHSTDNYVWPRFKRGQNVMIHWSRLPSSYDSWIQNTNLPANILASILDDLSETVNFQLKSWNVSASWVFDSEKFNEWMVEEDYEIDENEKRLTSLHYFTVDEFFNEKPKRKRKTTSIATAETPSETQHKRKKPKQKTTPTKSLAKSSQLTATLAATSTEQLATSSTVQLTTTSAKLKNIPCPDCEKMFTTEKLQKRHYREQHTEEKFECTLCDYSSKRKSYLEEHQRRQHFEPVKRGRARRNEAAPRKRSPFRKNVFDIRHKTSLEMIQMTLPLQAKMEEVLETSNELQKKIAKAESDNQKSQQRIKEMEDSKKVDTELAKVKTRLSMIEAKTSNYFNLPDISDIVGLLKYFNLCAESSKKDIENVIGLRKMELTNETLVSQDIFKQSHFTDEKRQKLIVFCNKAKDVLLKWRKQTKKNEIITIL